MASGAEKLLALYNALNPVDQAALLSFAEFLLQRAPSGQTGLVATPAAASEMPPAVPEDPLDIPRPDNESVIKAVKRLSETYPMLNKKEMLTETSDLVTQHVVMQRDKEEVIAELETVFERRYSEYRAQFPDDDQG